MKYLQLLVMVGFAGLIACTQSGCLVAAAAAGTGAGVAYVRGDTEAILEANPKQVADATVAAAKQMDLFIISQEATMLDSKVILRTAQDKRITVVARAEGDRVSKISIREGTFGSQPIQNTLLSKIRENLPAPSSTE